MFIDKIKDELNVSTTENGALGYATTDKALLDFNFNISSYRNKSENDIIVDFKKAWFEDKELALKYIFFARDIREGLGERRLFRTCIKSISNELSKINDPIQIFEWIKEYGRLDDIFVFVGTELENALIDFIAKQLTADMVSSMVNKPISLLAKWLPSLNTSSNKSRNLAKWLCGKLNMKQSTYRKTIARLRKYLNVIEQKTCANEWSEIDYEAVSSQANLKYRKAFLKHDTERRQEYLKSLEKGEAKINSSTNYPHDIVKEYRSDSNNWYDRYMVKAKDATLEALWANLPDYVKGEANTLVVRDGSGSMTSRIGKTNIQALDVSTALAIYFSEKCSGQYKDQFITFSSQPKLISLTNYDNLRDKLERCYKEHDCTNTNIEAVFKLVLDVACKYDLSQKDIPNLLIISDMEFDEATTTSAGQMDKLFITLKKKFNKKGYELPRLIFWNVNSRTGTIPITQNNNGVILVSGFSPAVINMVLSEQTDPYKALIAQLNKPRYEQVTLK